MEVDEDQNRLSAGGLKRLLNKRLVGLKDFNLSNCTAKSDNNNIRDEGMQLITTTPHLPSLQTLMLRNM